MNFIVPFDRVLIREKVYKVLRKLRCLGSWTWKYLIVKSNPPYDFPPIGKLALLIYREIYSAVPALMFEQY